MTPPVVDFGEFGLTVSETAVYVFLSSKGPCPVTEISEATGFHRTNVYDVLDKLQAKGLVSQHMDGGTHIFSAVNPEIFIEWSEERRHIAKALVERLKTIASSKHKHPLVEILREDAAVKTMVYRVMDEATEILALNYSDRLAKKYPLLLSHLAREMAQRDIVFKAISGSFPTSATLFGEERFMLTHDGGHCITFCWADSVAYVVWEESPVIVLIKSIDVAESFRKHFALLWSSASLTPLLSETSD